MDSPMEPKWTGMCGALAIRPPAASKIARAGGGTVRRGLRLPPQARVAAGEDLERGIDTGPVPCGQQIEQQTSHHRQTEPGVGAGRAERDVPRRGEGVVRLEPAGDRLRQEWPGLLVALQRPAIEGEEAALKIGLRRVGDESPHLA